MDFSLSEEEQALRDLVTQIISDNVSHASMRELEARGERVDRSTWQRLADAGVINALLPTSVGGSGLGVVALGTALEVIGEHAASVPLLSTVAMTALPVAEYPPVGLDDGLLAGIMQGDTLMACAPQATVMANETENGWQLTGTATLVIDGLDADHLLVPTSEGWFLINLDASGVERKPVEITSRRPVADVQLHAVEVLAAHRLHGDAVEIHKFIRQRTDVAIASVTVGLCAGAIRLMADHAQQRHQFDRPIASFQAVSQRAGDAFIDNLAIELTTHQATWRLDAELDAEREIAIARWWAAEGGYRIIHAASHIHGGIGVDYDYPLHRYILLARQLELTLGNSEQQLQKLGKSLREA